MKTMIVNWLTICIFLAYGGAVHSKEEQRLTLIQPQGNAPDIFIGYPSTPAERFAAQELRAFLEEMTGKKLRIRYDYWLKGAPPGTYIAVGKSKLTESIKTTGLTTEQYVIDVGADHLTIIGGSDRQRGVLYGVYDLLEQLGVRWYRPEPWGWHVPKQTTITLPLGQSVARISDYRYRSVLGGGFTRYRESTVDESELGSLWAVRNRLNGSDPGMDPRFGGRVTISQAHIFYQLIPVEEYFEKHPEYFCLYKGQRRKVNPDCTPREGNPTGLQLCLGNPELQELFAQKIIAQARGHTKHELDQVTFSVTPNDACPFCDPDCAACKALDDPRFPALISNRVCAFVNIVARKVAQAVPGARVSLCVYSTWTEPPTNIPRMEPNVCVHIAMINEWSDYTKTLMDPTSNWNKHAAESLSKWKALGVAEVYTYEYWSGYGWPGPLPLVWTMADRCREYRKFNVKGIYNETSPHWGPQGLELYMGAKLLWNPDLDVDRELQLYYQNYYGPAAAPMKTYHETMMQALPESRQFVFSGGRGIHVLFTPSLLKELNTCLKKAQALVKKQSFYQRRLEGVLAGYEFARRVSDILVLKKATGEKVESAGWPGKHFLHSPEAEHEYQKLVKWMDSFKEGDAIFDHQPKTELNYVSGDVLKNEILGLFNETDLLRDFD